MFGIRTSVIATIALIAVFAVALAACSVTRARSRRPSQSPVRRFRAAHGVPRRPRRGQRPGDSGPRVLHLDGNVSPASCMSRITGYVYNDYGQAARTWS